MAIIEVESLLTPISEAAPTGDNLEYDAAFAALETAAAGKLEQQVGETIVEGEPPDWQTVRRDSVELFARTKDLRVALHLARAALHLGGFAGLNEGLGLIRGMVERYWDGMFPQLDPDDGNDPTIRLTCFAGILDRPTLLALRMAPVVRTRSYGPLSVRDIYGDGGPDSKKVDPATVDGVFQEAELEALEATLAAIQSATTNLTAIDAALDSVAGQGADFSPISQILRQATGTLLPRVERRKAEAAGAPLDAAAEEGNAASGSAARGAFNPGGEIRSRDDVQRAIDQICGYYQRYEPTSPLPLLLGRCRRLVTMSFVDIVKDMVPDALDRVEIIAGKLPEPEQS
jgi:type VI secretion system protein ImpA